MKKDSKIYVAGHLGLVGSAILNNLREKGYKNFVLRSISELDLTNQQSVSDFFEREKPEYVFLAAAKVGGIMANSTYRAQFIYENLVIQNHIIHNSWKIGVKKLLFLGSTCIYPREAPQPMLEDSLLTSPLEYTNEPYAIAKIAGIKMCESYNLQYGTNFLCVMPTNLYGPNDNFNLETSHVLPALIRKIYLGKCLENNDWIAIRNDLAKRPIEKTDNNSNNADILLALAKYGIFAIENGHVSVEIWGSGAPMREFLWSEEMADACVFVMENVNFKDVAPKTQEIRNTHINIGTGKEISIKNLAELIKESIGFAGVLKFNSDKPDGTLRKLTDPTKIHSLGWHHKIEIEEGIERLYNWYLKN
ncbi:MAG: GDP-L-fucose synthase [Ignavibacteria bacterium]|nr:GDP-L-fucose synthase [Ignavibacteria bacterium]